jgi:hypothetical protein
VLNHSAHVSAILGYCLQQEDDVERTHKAMLLTEQTPVGVHTEGSPVKLRLKFDGAYVRLGQPI